jgi:hypothetical protein
MLKALKESVHRMTSHLQLISGYLELKDYGKALGKTKETIKELHASHKSDRTGERGDDRAEGWGDRGSAWLYGRKSRRCERRCR